MNDDTGVVRRIFSLWNGSMQRRFKRHLSWQCSAGAQVLKLAHLCFVFLSSLFQMEELKSDHEAMKQELENQHTEQLQRVREQCELSLQGQWTTGLSLHYVEHVNSIFENTSAWMHFNYSFVQNTSETVVSYLYVMQNIVNKWLYGRFWGG